MSAIVLEQDVGGDVGLVITVETGLEKLSTFFCLSTFFLRNPRSLHTRTDDLF
jgi:hypothetical protein